MRFPYIEEIRMKMVEKFNEFENYFVEDNMLLKFARWHVPQEAKICKEEGYAFPNWDIYASQNLHLYGYKLHAVCSIAGVFQRFNIAPASIHDIHLDCVLLVDKGYISQTVQLDLFNEVNIQLNTPKKREPKRL